MRPKSFGTFEKRAPGGYIFQHPIPLLGCNLITLHLAQGQLWIINIICHRWMMPIDEGFNYERHCGTISVEKWKMKIWYQKFVALAIGQSSDILLTSWQMQVTLKTFAVFFYVGFLGGTLSLIKLLDARFYKNLRNCWTKSNMQNTLGFRWHNLLKVLHETNNPDDHKVQSVENWAWLLLW